MNDFEQEYFEALVEEKEAEANMGYVDEEDQQTEPEREVKKMEETYPKFQMSVFMNGNKDQQFVIRANTIEEFRKLKSELLAELGQAVLEKTTQQAQPAQQAQTNNFGTCKDCGAERVKNPKTGKVFCKDKCWLNAQG